jgi:hypothetical protein
VASADGTIAAASSAIDTFFDLWGGVLADLLSLGVTIEQPVTADMVPGSPVLNEVNGVENLNREASAIPQRVGITSVLSDNDGLMWKGLRGANWESPHNAQMVIRDAFVAAGFAAAAYDDSTDVNAVDIRLNSYRLFNAGWDILYLDDDWCYFIGARDGEACLPSDGIVPASRQSYPGANWSFTITGPSHIEETKSSALDGQLRFDFDNVFGIPHKPPPPPGPTAVTVTGPSSADGCTGATWTATTTGGAAPITYEWTVEGNSYGTGTDNHLTYTNSGGLPSIFVIATATDANGGSKASAPFKTNIRLPGGC